MALTVTLANTGSQNGTASTIAVTLGTTFNANDMLVAFVACDNGGGGGSASLTTTATITGETVTNRRLNNHDPGSARAGDTMGVWTCTMATAKSGSETITFNKASADYVAVVLWKVTSDTSGYLPEYITVGGVAGAESTTASVTTGTINVGEVVIGATALEQSVTITQDGDSSNGTWSTQQGATAGSGDTAMQIRSQYKLQTTANSTQVYNTSWTGTYSSQPAYVSIREVALPYQITNWRFYDDSDTALAAEQTIPTLTGAQNKDVPLHLRVALKTTGTVSAASTSLEWSYDQTTWHVLETQTATTKPAFRYANGAGTAGGNVTNRLTGSDTAGIFIEAASTNISVAAADNDKEFDFCFKSRYAWPDTRIYLRPTTTGVSSWIQQNTIAIDTPTQATWEDDNGIKSAVSRTISSGAADGINFETYRPQAIYDGSLWWVIYMNADSLSTLRYRSWDGSTSPWSSEATLTLGSAAPKMSAHSACFYNNGGTKYIYVAIPFSTTQTVVYRGTISSTSISWSSGTAVTTSTVDNTSYMGIEVDQGGYLWLHGQSTTEMFAYRSTNVADHTAWNSKITTSTSRTLGGISDHTTLVPLASNDVLIFRITSYTSQPTVYCSRFTSTATTEVQVNATTNNHNTNWSAFRNSNDDIYYLHSDSNASSDTGNLVLRVSQDAGANWTNCTSPSVTMNGTSMDGAYVMDDGARGCYIFYTLGEVGDGNTTLVMYKHYNVTGSAVTTGSWDSAVELFGTGMGNGDAMWAGKLGSNLMVFHERGDDDFDDTPLFYITYGSVKLGVSFTASGTASATGSATFTPETPSQEITFTATGTATTTGNIPDGGVTVEHSVTAAGTATATGEAAFTPQTPANEVTFTASGSATSTGSAAFAPDHPVTASGTATATGSADFSITGHAVSFTASGSSTTTGASTFGVDHSVSATSTATAIGTAAIGVDHSVSAAGSSTSVGSATFSITVNVSFVASGSATSTGAATATVEHPVTASETTTSAGSATFTVEKPNWPAVMTGTATTAATASATVEHPVTAAGTATTTGTANFSITGHAVSFTAAGSSTTTGTATFVRATDDVIATGFASTIGTATFIPDPVPTMAGVATATGSATAIVEHSVTASGTASTTGTAEFIPTGTGELVATGAASAVGAATFSVEHSFTISGVASATGVVTATTDHIVTGGGSSATSGSATFSITGHYVAFSASGTTTTGAVANATVDHPVTTTGTANATGTATFEAVGESGFTANGTASATGSATFSTERALTATGSSTTSGNAGFTCEHQVSMPGASSTVATALFVVEHPAVATGTTATEASLNALVEHLLTAAATAGVTGVALFFIGQEVELIAEGTADAIGAWVERIYDLKWWNPDVGDWVLVPPLQRWNGTAWVPSDLPVRIYDEDLGWARIR